jgi:hypothetical protein
MTKINPEAYELSPTDLDATAAFYDRLAAKVETITRRIPILPYRGHTNYSTWLLCTAVLSNPDLYARLITILEKFDEVSPVAARLAANALVRRYFPTIPEANWYHIDWRNVAEVFNEALEEHRSYACAERACAERSRSSRSIF